MTRAYRFFATLTALCEGPHSRCAERRTSAPVDLSKRLKTSVVARLL